MNRERSTISRGESGRFVRRRGAMLVLIAILLPVLLFLVAMAVDIGYIQLVRTEMRASTDAAARAAGESLSRTQSVGQARQAAKDLASANPVAGSPLLLDNSDIVFGQSTMNADGSWNFTANGTPTNAVQINSKRTKGSLSGSVPLFFGRFFGVKDFEPSQSASSVRMDRDICLVVDRSSSMKLSLASDDETISSFDPRFVLAPIMGDSRWGALSVAVNGFLDELVLTPYDEHVSLVSFGSEGTWVGLHNNASDLDQSLTADPGLVRTALSIISLRVFNGATNIAAGMDTGVAALTDASKARPFAAKTLVLMTDGYPTAGRSPVDCARDAAAKNITVHTVTFGASTDQTLMESTAAAAGGKHYHAPDAARLKAIFKEIALSLPVVLTD
jgi:Ca-activated chloride channel family protein